MAQFRVVKLNLPGEDNNYGISNKKNSYIPNLGTFKLRRDALIAMHEANIGYFQYMSDKAYQDMLQLMKKSDKYEVDEDSDRFKNAGDKSAYAWTSRGDLLC